MSYLETLAQVDSLRAAVVAHGTLPAEVLKKLNYKFRLEWNYTSNSMEGNSLTRSETRSVMIGNITVNGKPIKDVLEMKKHDEVITTLLKMGFGEVPLSEARIREIHTGIMHEEDPAKAAFIGKWKTDNNYLYNYKKERIDFTPHTEVAEAMHRLTDWLAAEREKIARKDAGAQHPALLAFEFHLRYVTIHPFYDGNGRTARIFTNLILVAYGYPPVWVNDGVEKTQYYQYLADVQGYGGSPEVFYDFMAGLLLRSQQMVLDAVEGREIEELSDYLKELELLKKRVANEPINKSPKIVFDTFNDVKERVWTPLQSVLKSFDDLFVESKDEFEVNGQPQKYKTEKRYIGDILRAEISAAPKPVTIYGHDVYESPIWLVNWHHTKYALKGALNVKDFTVDVKVKFEDQSYALEIFSTREKEGSEYSLEAVLKIEKLYSNSWTEDDVEHAKSTLGKHILKSIRSYIFD